jgi:hypothetical protein
VSITHVDLTADEAIKELKAAKVVEQNAIAILQTDRWPHISQTAREQSIAGHRRRLEALHMAIAALVPR